MSYVDRAKELVSEEYGEPLHPDLLDLYTLLCLSLGPDVANRDVHDAWAIWRQKTDRDHKSIIPYSELSRDVRDLDTPFTEAIHRAAKRL